MAQQTTVTLTDDIDGGKATESIQFGLDGAQYEIDLSAKNAKNLRKAVAEFMEAGRKIKPFNPTAGRATRRFSAGKSSVRAEKSDSSAIRAWAAENGVSISARGRISASVQEQYAAAVATVGAGADAVTG